MASLFEFYHERLYCSMSDRNVNTTPPWVEGDEIPNPESYLSSECFVAGALSTMKPFNEFHPAWCLPFARQTLDALSEWEPTD